MYYPYLRGRRQEVLAVRDCAALLGENQQVHPVIEPASVQFSSLRKTLATLAETGAPHTIVVNPRVGELADDHTAVHGRIVMHGIAMGAAIRPGLLLHAGVGRPDVQAFLDKYRDRPVVLVHSHGFREVAELKSQITRAGNVEANLYFTAGTSPGYHAAIGKETGVVVEDRFRRQLRNADYANDEDEYFCDVHRRFKGEGYVGFGDFLTVGQQFIKGGGAAHAVTIHMTHEKDDGCVWVRHFVSDQTETGANQRGKTLEALRKLQAFVEGSRLDFSYSTAVPEWIEAANTAAVPSLATLKRLSLRHHIELMANLLH